MIPASAWMAEAERKVHCVLAHVISLFVCFSRDSLLLCNQASIKLKILSVRLKPQKEAF